MWIHSTTSSADTITAARPPWALAYRELGEERVSARLLQELLEALEAASQKPHAEVKIDYFATSLATFLLFEDDLQKRNRVQCLYLMGLAQRGLGQMGHAERSFRETPLLDINHLYAQQELRMWPPETRTA